MSDLVLYERDIERINKILSHLLTESAASYVLLANKNGLLISQVGFAPNFDVTSLAALVAGSFASTKALAGLIGETEFTVMFHQGQKDNIHISLVDDEVIMVLIFDDRTNLGMVKMVASQAKSKLENAFAMIKNNEFIDEDDNGSHGEGGGDVGDRIDEMFSNE